MSFLIASPDRGAGALVAAVIFILVALGAATIDEKNSTEGPASTPAVTPAPAGDYFASNLDAFRGPARLTSAQQPAPRVPGGVGPGPR